MSHLKTVVADDASLRAVISSNLNGFSVAWRTPHGPLGPPWFFFTEADALEYVAFTLGRTFKKFAEPIAIQDYPVGKPGASGRAWLGKPYRRRKS